MHKFISIQAARGIAALMVLAFHAMSVDAKYSSAGLLSSALSFGQTGVDLFFVVSGFVMAVTTRRRSGAHDAGRFLVHRAARIYPTYWVYFFALLAVYAVAPAIVNSSQGGRVDLWHSFLLLPSATLPLLMVAWSLTLELWFYVVFALLVCAPRKILAPALAAWAGAIFLYAMMSSVPESPYARVLVHPFTLEFIAGALVGLFTQARAYPRITQANALAFLLAGLGLLAWGYFGNFVDGSDVIATARLDRVLVVGSGYALTILGLVSLEANGVIAPFALLGRLGNSSYSLYLSHLLTLNLCARIWFSSPAGDRDSLANAALFWVLCIVACLAVGVVGYHLTERPVQRLMARLDSSKRVDNASLGNSRCGAKNAS